MTDDPRTRDLPLVPDDNEVAVIKLPNTLKARLTGGLLNIQLNMDPERLECAEAEIERLAPDYLDWVEDDFQKLETAFAELVTEPALDSPSFEAVTQGAFEIASQGGTFDFHLLTAIGKSLYDFARDLTRLEPEHVLIMGLHIDGIRVVLHKRMKGEGGSEGTELMTMLYKAVDKYL